MHGEDMDGARIAALEAAAILKARYFRLMDTKDWAGWQDLFTPDAVMDVSGEAAVMKTLGIDVGDGSGWVLHGAETIRQSVEQAMTGVVSVHHGHMGEIDLAAPGRVNAIWAMEDVIRYPAGAPIVGFHGYGHYHDTYVLDGGTWRIQRLKLTRLLMSPV